MAHDRTARGSDRLALVIDLGSSSVRAGLWRPDGTTVRGAWRETWSRLETDRPGQATIDPATLLDRVHRALDELVAAVPTLLGRVEVAAVSCFLHSLVPLDARGRPLGPIETWADTRAGPAARELRDELEGRADWQPTDCQRTGCPLAASFWPAKIRAAAARYPAARWAGAPELVAEHLTGRRASAHNVASATGLLDRLTLDWDAPLLDALALTADRLPELVDDGTTLGALTPALGERWPALADVPWLAPWGDAASSNVGLGAVGRESAAVNVGTSAALRSIVEAPPEPLPHGLFAFRLFDRTLVGGQLAEGGGVLDWLARALRRDRNRLEAAAAALPPAEHGLVVLPWLAGQRALDYREAAFGAVAGLSLATDAVALYQAMAESIALGLAEVDEALTGALGAPPAIVGGGGGVAKSPLMGQLIADALGRSVTIARAAEATSRGAALLALHGGAALGPGRPLPPTGRTIEPRPEASRIYADARARRRALAERLLDSPATAVQA